MKRFSRGWLIGLSALILLLVVAIIPALVLPYFSGSRQVATTRDEPVIDDPTTVEVTDYSAPKDTDTLLVDDRIEDKKTTFDPALVDRRPLEDWSLNASEAVIRLDVPMVNPDQNPERLILHPSYALAVKNARWVVLPSVNMIDGKAKQFDDGLYAAIDQAYYLGQGESMKSHLATLQRIHAKVGKGTLADDYLSAGLSLGSETVKLTPRAKTFASDFLAEEVYSKPSGFYTWTRPLTDCFRVLRYFARPMPDRSIPTQIARVFREDQALKRDYVAAYSFYAKMTNPLVGLTPVDFIDSPPQPKAVPDQVTLFPSSTSRESELFDKLFPGGVPSHANLMRELITAIRSGAIDLKPRPAAGWYEYQVYALESLLLPEKGEESNKLLLTKTYKKRMLEAFKALITKRRETHLRQAEPKAEPMEAPPVRELSVVRPRLRVEPNPTYYLRTARSYAFLATFLESTLGESTLKSLHGLRETGPREPDLHAELRSMRDLFYGLYLLSSEDIGSKPALLEGETVDREQSEKVASEWLARLATDPDLAADTRVSIPLSYDRRSKLVKLWMTIGVRVTGLNVRYERVPRVRPANASGDWQLVEPHKLAAIDYVIPVDEFAEVEIKGGRVFTRAELRAICDQYKTKEKIVEALQR